MCAWVSFNGGRLSFSPAISSGFFFEKCHHFQELLSKFIQQFLQILTKETLHIFTHFSVFCESLRQFFRHSSSSCQSSQRISFAFFRNSSDNFFRNFSNNPVRPPQCFFASFIIFMNDSYGMTWGILVKTS